MSAYGEFKKRNIVYVARLYLRDFGLVDFDERHDELRALEVFDDLVDEANLDTFGEGIYEVSLMREWWYDGILVKAECIKKNIIDRGDAR